MGRWVLMSSTVPLLSGGWLVTCLRGIAGDRTVEETNSDGVKFLTGFSLSLSSGLSSLSRWMDMSEMTCLSPWALWLEVSEMTCPGDIPFVF